MTVQNLLIEAGAGTGKTTRLVKAVTDALFTRRIPLEAIVVLTFTNKAAGELKDRIALALEDVLEAVSFETLRHKPWWPEQEAGLSLTDLKTAAAGARTVLDRANISTIHSFAFSLLKRFPLAAGIAPDAEIDDKNLRFDDLFRREWPRWLTVELGDASPREALWLDVLSHFTLPTLEETTRLLADFSIPLSTLPLSNDGLAERLKPFHEKARALAASHRKNEKADRLAVACEDVIGRWTQPDLSVRSLVDEEHQERIHDTLSGRTASWSEAEYRQLKSLQLVARNLLADGDRLVARCTEALTPFVASFRQTLLMEGCLTHSALLTLSRDMLRDHHDIRAALKKQFRMILVDEFQDTDPVQADLMLYLAEAVPDQSTLAEDVRLEAGKLFIVGDPKQSIYRFRGADIAAYGHVGRMIVGQGGKQETLETNYRSQAQIIHLVNAAFHRIIQEEADISPVYRPVHPHHPHDATRPLQDVQLWLAESPTPQSVEDAQITEAEHVAQWIAQAKERLEVHDPREGRRPLLYRDVALIFRTYKPMDPFIDALRRYNIPFAVESERYFFTTPEVTDILNLLHAADNPLDTLSLIGFLRGPLARYTDEDLLRHKNAGSLEDLPEVRWLRQIGDRLRREPLAEVLDSLFADTFLMEFATRSYHGDQTVANVLKLRRLLEDFASEGVTTMGLLLERLEVFFADDKIEGESPLADENYNAVRLLTVHKSKGLEFPVVFLPSLHSEVRPRGGEPYMHDWRTGAAGLSITDVSGRKVATLDKLALDEQSEKRELAEENRILYVAMTRARECLVLSGGTHLKSARTSTYLHRLTGAWEQTIEELKEGVLAVGEHTLTVRRLAPTSRRHDTPLSELDDALGRLDIQAFAKRWNERADEHDRTVEIPAILSPSTLKAPGTTGRRRQNEAEEADTPPQREWAPKVFGTLMHLILETWPFSADRPLERHVDQTVRRFLSNSDLPPEWAAEPHRAAMVQEAVDLMRHFMTSDDYKELCNSTILGREIPFVYAEGPQTLMRGTIDVVYRRADGTLVIGDYKTDRENDKRSDVYEAQGRAYGEALRRSTGLQPQFKLIYLRGTPNVQAT